MGQKIIRQSQYAGRARRRPTSRAQRLQPIVAGLIVVALAVGVLTFLGNSTPSEQQAAASAASQFPDRGPIPGGSQAASAGKPAAAQLSRLSDGALAGGRAGSVQVRGRAPGSPELRALFLRLRAQRPPRQRGLLRQGARRQRRRRRVGRARHGMRRVPRRGDPIAADVHVGRVPDRHSGGNRKGIQAAVDKHDADSGGAAQSLTNRDI